MADTPNPSPPADETPDQLRERIKELERRVAGLTFEIDGLREIAYKAVREQFPERVMTEQQVADVIHGRPGGTISDVLAEFDDPGHPDPGAGHRA